MDFLPLAGVILFMLLVVMLLTAFAEEAIYKQHPFKKKNPLVTEFLVGIVSISVTGGIALAKAPSDSDPMPILSSAFFNVGAALFLLALSILPVYLLGRYIYRHDFDKEPKNLLIKLFIGGIGSIILTFILSYTLISIFPFFGTDIESLTGLLPLIPYVFIGIALVEEFAKWFFVWFFGYKNREFNHAYDAIVYAVFVALGFACIENMLYVFLAEEALMTALMRSITAVPGHVSFGILMGYYLALAKIAEKNQNFSLARSNKIKSIVIPMIAHGIYNYCIFASVHVGVFTIVFLFFVVYLFNEMPKKVKQLAMLRNNIGDQVVKVNQEYSYKFCPGCGENVIGNFCHVCGFNHNKVETIQ